MSFAERIVVDTGIWVSAALRPASLPAQAVALGFARYEVCVSGATLEELQRVLTRDKFDRYLPRAARDDFFQPRNRSWTDPSGLPGSGLARRDDAAGCCPPGGATPPARSRAAQSGR